MNTLNILYHLALADFYERARRYGFLLTLGAVIYLGVLVNNGTLGMDMGSGGATIAIRYHGELNSAWIGTMTVMVVNTFLGLIGFYLVKDCITRDIRTGVGQIIATTPVSRVAYLMGKWISNFMVLSVLVLILAAAAVIMVLFQSETALDLKALLMPFLAQAYYRACEITCETSGNRRSVERYSPGTSCHAASPLWTPKFTWRPASAGCFSS